MYLQLAIVYQLLEISSQFDRRCPVMREKDYISRVVCKDPSRYHCLAVDHLRLNNYRAECKDKTWVSAGYHPVLRGRYIDFEACSEDSYQPVVYWSNERYKCTFLKTTCSEIGQSRCDTDNTTTDYTCSCDTSRGYYFTSSRNKCHCNPFLEDCSCFFHPDGVLSNINKDLTCRREQLVTDKCKIVHFTTSKDLSIMKDTGNKSETFEYKQIRGQIFYIGLTGLIGLEMLVTIVFAIKTIVQPLEGMEEDKKQNVSSKTASSQKPAKYLKVSEETKENRKQTLQTNTTSSKEPVKNPIVSEETQPKRDVQVSTKTNSADKPANHPQVLDTQPKRDAQIPSKTVSTNESAKHPEKIADILVLHVEDSTTTLSTFTNHLAKCLPEGITVTIHNPRLHCEPNKPCTLHDILSRCDLLFVYLESKFSEEALSHNGYDGVDIIKNINTRNVIKVGSSVITRRLRENYRIQLNITELNKEDLTRKVIDLLLACKLV